MAKTRSNIVFAFLTSLFQFFHSNLVYRLYWVVFHTPFRKKKKRRIMLWQCPTVRSSVRPSVSTSRFSALFSTCFIASSWNLRNSSILWFYTSNDSTDQVRVSWSTCLFDLLKYTRHWQRRILAVSDCSCCNMSCGGGLRILKVWPPKPSYRRKWASLSHPRIC